MTLKILDLFSGIGGFSLGLERAGMETIAFCEIDEYCRKVLKKHWANVPIYKDVTSITKEFQGKPDVITGGFPCQDVSIAGKREEDAIHGKRTGLYRAMLDAVSFYQPRWVIFENVANLLTGESGRWFSIFLNDLSRIGYDAQWHIIRASDIGKVHRRSRVWIIAYSSKIRPIQYNALYNKLRDKIRQCRAHKEDVGILNAYREFQYEETYPDHRKFDGLSEVAHRLGALGNSVVPEIPEIIGKAIIEVEGFK